MGPAEPSPGKVACGVVVAGVTIYGVVRLIQDFIKYFPGSGSGSGHKSEAQRFREELDLEPGAICLNHGSYGTVPKVVAVFQEQLRQEMESHPFRWFRRITAKRFAEASASVAEMVKAPAECVTMVDNATTGLNAVLGSMQLSGDDEVMVTTLTYEAVKYTAQYVCERRNIKYVLLELSFPILSEDDLVAKFEAKLDKHPNVRVCVVDHITSPTAVVMPVKRLAALLHKRGIRVVVDGAHGPGQLDLDMIDLDADYYTGNLHKWCFAPRGCAFLYVRQQYLDEVMPCVISWHWKEPFQARFEKIATRDQTALFSATAALKFINERCGGQAAMVKRNSEMAAAAAELLTIRWGTEQLDVPSSMLAPYMRLIRLPIVVSQVYDNVELAMMDLYDASNISTYMFDVDNVPYIRISVNLYNELWEYEWLAQAVVQLCERKLQV